MEAERPQGSMSGEGAPARNGKFAAMEHRPRTPEAALVAERLSAIVIEHETRTGARTYQRREAKLVEFVETAGRFAADLLRAQADKGAEGRCFRSMQKAKFTGDVSYLHFKALVEAMEALGLVTRVAGARRGVRSAFADAGAKDAFSVTEALAATFTATPSFLAMAAAVGVTPESVGEHFAPGAPADLIFLRAGKPPMAGHNERGALIDFRASERLRPHGALVDTMEAELASLNEFAAKFPLAGATHHGFYRTFNLGDDPAFRWNKGGRVVSLGTYQNTSKEGRRDLTIGGEPVQEIDVEASHLTLAYGLLGITVESMTGAYEVEGLPSLVLDGKDWRRWAVKTWTTVTFGAGKPMRRWPEEHRAKFTKGTGRDLGTVFPPSAVARAMVEKHPVLDGWQHKGVSWADLQFAESNALVGAMLSLMREHRVPAFPIHDSLLVRARDFGVAREALSDHYRRLCSFSPSLG